MDKNQINRFLAPKNRRNAVQNKRDFSSVTPLFCMGIRERDLRKMWFCKCVCGTTLILTDKMLNYKKSCGCIRRSDAVGHNKGATKLPEYSSWQSMITRCTCKTQSAYARYGGRGIKVCKRWLRSVYDFAQDMGNRPSPNHSIDRKDNDGNYSCGHCDECKKNGWPMNCRWATMREQNVNKSNTVKFRLNGETKCRKNMAHELNVHYDTIRSRLKNGWPFLCVFQ